MMAGNDRNEARKRDNDRIDEEERTKRNYTKFPATKLIHRALRISSGISSSRSYLESCKGRADVHRHCLSDIRRQKPLNCIFAR